jgi:tripartite-type tricarboxylate transporter receptor subunit TctC
MKKGKLVASLVMLGLVLAGPCLAADKYPSKPVEMIVSFAPGGGQDVTFRIFAKYAEKYLGQRIAVVNKTGGGGVIGNTEIMKSRPDGYTIGTWTNGLVTDEMVIKGVPYTYKNFLPLVHIAADPNVFSIKNSLKMDFAQFIKHAKDNPDKVSIGMGGNWTAHDFFRVKLEKATGMRLQRVPFQGGAPAIQAVAGETCDSSTPFVPEVLPMLESKLVTPLAVSSEKRVSALPNIPTVKELGFNVVQYIWRGLSVPPKTPPEIVSFLETVFKKTYDDPECQNALIKAGVNPIWKGHKEFVKYVEEEHATYLKLVKELGVEAK